MHIPPQKPQRFFGSVDETIKLGCGCLGLLAILAFVAILIGTSLCNGSDPESEAERAEERRQGMHCLSTWDGSNRAFKEAVSYRLNDPNSLEEIETWISPLRDGRHRIRMEFTAENIFGGRLRYTAYGWVDTETCEDFDSDVIIDRIE